METADEFEGTNKDLILMGCTDAYAELIIDYKKFCLKDT